MESSDAPLARQLFPEPARNETKSRALAYVNSNRSPSARVRLVGPKYIAGACQVSVTDPDIFSQFGKKTPTAETVLAKWRESDCFRETASEFVKNILDPYSKDIRTPFMDLFNYCMDNMQASVELSVGIVILLVTEKFGNYFDIADKCASSQSTALMLSLLLEQYLMTDDETYDADFRSACVRRSLELTDAYSGTVSQLDKKSLPGWNRLIIADSELRADVWAYLFIDICNYVGGSTNLSRINHADEKRKYFCPSDDSKEHPLRQNVMEDGRLVPFTLLFPREQSMFGHLHHLEATTGVDNVCPSLHDRIGNILRMMHPDFRTEWWENYRVSPSVPAGTIIPENSWPVISMEVMVTLIEETTVRVDRDEPKRRQRIKTKSSKGPNDKSKTNDNRQNSSFFPKELPSCTICGAMDHKAQSCEKSTYRSGRDRAECRIFKATGRCRYGDNCIHLHGVSDIPTNVDSSASLARGNTKIPMPRVSSSNSSSAPAEGSNTEYVKVECRNKACPECLGMFNINVKWWEERGLNRPVSCAPCRAVAKASKATDKPSSTAPAAMITAVCNSGTDKDSDVDDEFFFTLMLAISDESDGSDTDVDDSFSIADDIRHIQWMHRVKRPQDQPKEVRNLLAAGAQVLSPDVERKARAVSPSGWESPPFVPEGMAASMLADVGPEKHAALLDQNVSRDSIDLEGQDNEEIQFDLAQNAAAMGCQLITSYFIQPDVITSRSLNGSRVGDDTDSDRDRDTDGSEDVMWVDREVGPVEDKSHWMCDKGIRSVVTPTHNSHLCYPYLSTNAGDDLDFVALPCDSGDFHGEPEVQDFW